jgi:ABC-type dipeptide/oligopeptide/nickel transport system ATPase component
MNPTRVAVLQAGRFVELGPVERVLSHPKHRYTQALLATVPQVPA